MLYSVIKKGVFQDSVSLMLLSKKLTGMPNVSRISIMMGTAANKEIFANTGLLTDDIEQAQSSDLCIAIDAVDDSIIASVVSEVDSFLSDQSVKKKSANYPQTRSLRGALNVMHDANLALISIAGQYAAREAKKALLAGLNVFIFSDNVSISDELALKQLAHQRNLLVMGPDCGTGAIKGVPLAFSNVNKPGGIGIIGASGTGIQAILAGVDGLNAGISHAIGLGGRDLSLDIGGISALDAIDLLVTDEQTEVIVFVSKPPADSIKEKVITKLAQQPKPVVAIFLGEMNDHVIDNIEFVTTLDQAAYCAVERWRQVKIQQARSKMAREQKKIKGLFCGGTLAAEAALMLAHTFNLPVDAKHDNGIMFEGNGHCVIDLGDDAYTIGRAHPMIDPTVRNEMLINAATDAETAIILLDVVIGYGAHPEPAQQLVEAIEQARQQRAIHLGEVLFIAFVCGTQQDFQDINLQKQILTDAGVMVVANNKQMVETALSLIALPHTELTQVEQNEPDLLKLKPKVINIGLTSFADNLRQTNTDVIQVNWAPPAGGNESLIAALDRLT